MPKSVLKGLSVSALAFNGVIILNKPQGFTSHDAVAKLRGMLKTRKIGHAGTLDPMAQGVLVVLLGNATKASDYLMGGKKRYRAGFKTGFVSDTLDIWGSVSQTGLPSPGQEQVQNAVMSFKGGYTQVPPMYSAIQKNGVRLYDLARRGIEVERQGRRVDIEDISLISYENGRGVIELACSKGTYIRTLCHDIGQKLGCGAVMDSLVRLGSGDFQLEKAYTLEQLQSLADGGRAEEAVIPTDRIFSSLPFIKVDDTGFKRALNGAYIGEEMITGGRIPESEGVLCAVYSQCGRLVILAKSGRLDVSGAPALFHEKTFYTGDANE